MFPKPYFIDTNGIRMAVHEQGEGPPVILLHGFPELAYSWRHQLPALAEAGFRAIAPDQRGYGNTSGPEGVDAYAASELIADLHGLLDALNLETATFVGHDWGALVLWQMAVIAPQRIERLVMLNIPYIPRSTIDPIEAARARLGDDFYIVNFQDSDEADKLFESDPRHFFQMLMRRNQITREQFEQLPKSMRSLSLIETAKRTDSGGEPLLTSDELDVFVEAFTRSGFTKPINWYRNWSRNWQALDGIDPIVRIPTLFIGAEDDIIISPENIEAMTPFVPELESHLLRRCGHWSQQEKPHEINELIIKWLKSSKSLDLREN